MHKMDKLEKLFSDFGVAMHYAQFIEYDLISLFLIDAMEEGTAKIRHVVAEFVWKEKTLGRLIKYLEKTPYLDKDIAEFFDEVREKRNFLVHKFFIEHAEDMDTELGIDTALQDLGEITEVLKKCRIIVHETVKSLASGALLK